MSSPDPRVPQFELLVDGAPVARAVADALTSIEISQSLVLLDMVVLTLDNPGARLSDGPTFDQGKEIEVRLGYLGKLVPVAKAEIVALEPVWPADADDSPFLIVRAYDKAHRLRRGKKTRSFASVKVSDLVTKLAQEDGLTAEIQPTSTKFDYLLQSNVSNMDFLHELARRCGYELEVDTVAKKLVFRTPPADKPKAGTLAWGHDLVSFSVKKTLTEVSTQAVTKGWDPKSKKTIVGKAKKAKAELGTPHTSTAKSAWGEGTRQFSIRPVSSTIEAEEISSQAVSERAMDAVTGRGTLVGDTAWKPGQVVALEGLGKAWDGSYYLTAATHFLHRASGFTTEIQVRSSGTGTGAGKPPAPPPAPPPPAQAGPKNEFGAQVGHASGP